MSKEVLGAGESASQFQPIGRDLVETNKVMLSPRYFFWPAFEALLESPFFKSLNNLAHLLTWLRNWFCICQMTDELLYSS